MIERQIEALFEQGRTPAAIAETLGLEESAVRWHLEQIGKRDESDIPEDDFAVIRSRLIDIAKHSEDENLAAKTGMYLWDQKRGTARDRKQAPSLNLLHINTLIAQSHTAVVKALTTQVDGRPDTTEVNQGPAKEDSNQGVLPSPGPQKADESAPGRGRQ